MSINVQKHISKLMNLDDDAYMRYLEDLTEELSINQPLKWMIKSSINNATKPFVTEPDRDRLFQKLVDFDLTSTSFETIEQVTRLLPSPVENISVQILPAIESKGGGASYAPGKIILCIRTDEFAPMRVKRNIAHEYSHTVRMIQKPQETEHGFGEAVPYSLRDYLIFEGLASVLPETLYPLSAVPIPEVCDEREADFWEKADLSAVGMDAYIKYMSIAVYEIGSRVIRKYLDTHSLSIIEAHSRSDEDLYWKSGYPLIR